jgi:hypothetical protein
MLELIRKGGGEEQIRGEAENEVEKQCKKTTNENWHKRHEEIWNSQLLGCKANR